MIRYGLGIMGFDTPSNDGFFCDLGYKLAIAFRAKEVATITTHNMYEFVSLIKTQFYSSAYYHSHLGFTLGVLGFIIGSCSPSSLHPPENSLL